MFNYEIFAGAMLAAPAIAASISLLRKAEIGKRSIRLRPLSESQTGEQLVVSKSDAEETLIFNNTDVAATFPVIGISGQVETVELKDYSDSPTGPYLSVEVKGQTPVHFDPPQEENDISFSKIPNASLHVIYLGPNYTFKPGTDLKQFRQFFP